MYNISDSTIRSFLIGLRNGDHRNVVGTILLIAIGPPLVSALKFVWSVVRAISWVKKIARDGIPHDSDFDHPIWGIGMAFANMTAARALDLLHTRHGGVIIWRALNRVTISIAEPKLAQIVVSKLNLPKSDYAGVKDLVGDSLLTCNGKEWQHRRKSINPAFKVSFLQNVLAPVVVSQAKIMFDTMFPKTRDGSVMDLQESFSKITLDVIGIAGFGYDFGFVSSSTGLEAELSSKVLNLLEEPNLRLRNPLRKYYKIRAAIKYSRNLSGFKALALKVIRDAQAQQNATKGGETGQATSIVGLILQQTNLSEQEIVNEVNTFLLAGHETSASTLSFMFLIMDMFPEVKKKVVEEVDKVIGRDQDPDFEDMVNFRYMNAVIKETLRFFPIGWATSRISKETIAVGEYTIPAETPIMVNYFSLHRNPLYWDSPLEFKPERWLVDNSQESASESVDERSGTAIPFSYLPFSGGPRSCIGKPFAEIEIKLLTAMMVQKYDWKIQVPDEWNNTPFHDLYTAGTTLRPLPHFVQITPRK